MMRERTAWWTALRTDDWKPTDESDDGSSRRLFTVPEESEDAEQGGPAPPGSGYGSMQSNEAGSSSAAEPEAAVQPSAA